MRIVVVTSATLPPREGIGYYVENLARQYVRLGHDVKIVSRKGKFRGGDSLSSEISRIELSPIPIPPFHVDAMELQLKCILGDLAPRPDLIHYHSPLVPCIRSDIPTVVTFHSPMQSGVSAMEHSSMHYVASTLMLKVSSLRHEKKLLEYADAVTTVSDSVTKAICSPPYSAEKLKVETIGNGVDTEYFTPDERRREDKSVFWAGRLAPGKGIEDLVKIAHEAMAIDPETRFRVAGEGPLREHLARSLKKHGLQRSVALLGHLQTSEMVEEYQRASILLITSHYEGMSTVMLEAMSCETPCLCTRVGSALEVIRDGDNGYLVNSGSAQEVAERISMILGQRSHVRELIGKKARETVVKNHCWPVIGQKYQNTLMRITKAEVK